MKGGRATYYIEIVFHMLIKQGKENGQDLYRSVIVRSFDYDISLFMERIAFKYKLLELLAPGIRNRTNIDYVDLVGYNESTKDIQSSQPINYTYLLEYASIYAGRYIYEWLASSENKDYNKVILNVYLKNRPPPPPYEPPPPPPPDDSLHKNLGGNKRSKKSRRSRRSKK